MIEEITIAEVATYGSQPQILSDLRPINFIFGTNGAGKTTISRIIADPSDPNHFRCDLKWKNERTLDTFVYNRDFVERNFTQQPRGIFTLGEAENETLKEIDEARRQVEELEKDVTQLKGTLGKEDEPTGKFQELQTLRERFEDLCWKIKQEHDEHFQYAFKGVRNSRSKFFDKLLIEFSNNKSDLHPLNDLKERARSLFQEGGVPYALLPEINADELINCEKSAILSKKVFGKEDVDIGSLILHLGNSDWVHQGLQYVEGPGSPCPFCQKTLEADLWKKLTDFFDDAYLRDISIIEQVRECYSSATNITMTTVNTALASDSPYIDTDKLRSLRDQLASLFETNWELIERKQREPSTSVQLKRHGELLERIAQLVENANSQILRHNTLLRNKATEREQLINEVWRRIVEDNKKEIQEYISKNVGIDKAIENLKRKIDEKTSELSARKYTLQELERKVTSVLPTVSAINKLLDSFGFTSFRLTTQGDKNEYYAIVRPDGSDAHRTLSEGERSFITFLYFYHLIQGSFEAHSINTDRIVVFDDPVSSLDSDVLFIVSALIRRVIKSVLDRSGQIKQVFVLTHNVYFHKEVTFDPKRRTKTSSSETFWIVRKSNHNSHIERHDTNPIKTSYELLWSEVRNKNRSNHTIQNTLRRIIEHYFTILGNMDKDSIINEFQGQEQQICASLFSWMNDGSHNFEDDLYITASPETVDRYLEVFKKIFIVTEHDKHYYMMMGAEEADRSTEPLPSSHAVQQPAQTVANTISGAAYS